MWRFWTRMPTQTIISQITCFLLILSEVNHKTQTRTHRLPFSWLSTFFQPAVQFQPPFGSWSVFLIDIWHVCPRANYRTRGCPNYTLIVRVAAVPHFGLYRTNHILLFSSSKYTHRRIWQEQQQTSSNDGYKIISQYINTVICVSWNEYVCIYTDILFFSLIRYPYFSFT